MILYVVIDSFQVVLVSTMLSLVVVMDGQGSDLDGNHSGERERDFINEIFHIYTCISLISTCETRRFSMY